MILIFTKPGCPQCEKLKKGLKEERKWEEVEEHNVTTKEGLKELAWHELVSTAEKGLPIVLVRNEGTGKFIDTTDIANNIYNFLDDKGCDINKCTV
jgi:glutaredoxin